MEGMKTVLGTLGGVPYNQVLDQQPWRTSLAVAYARGADPESIAPVETRKLEPQELLDQSLCSARITTACTHRLVEASMLLTGQAAKTTVPLRTVHGSFVSLTKL